MSREFRTGLLRLEVKKPGSIPQKPAFRPKDESSQLCFSISGKGISLDHFRVVQFGEKTEEGAPSTTLVPTPDGEHLQASPFTNHCSSQHSQIKNGQGKRDITPRKPHQKISGINLYPHTQDLPHGVAAEIASAMYQLRRGSSSPLGLANALNQT